MKKEKTIACCHKPIGNNFLNHSSIIIDKKSFINSRSGIKTELILQSFLLYNTDVKSAFACFFRIFRYNKRMRKFFLILTTALCFNGFAQEAVPGGASDPIEEETRRNLKEARRNLSELFLIMTEELKTPAADGEPAAQAAAQPASEPDGDEKIEMAAELLDLPAETVRRFVAEQKGTAAEKAPADETKVKSFISDKSLTVYDADNETLEIPAETLFTTEEELESYIEQFANQRIVLTAKRGDYKTSSIVKCESGTEITLRSSQNGYDTSPVFSVWGVLLPPSDFYLYARITDAVFIQF